MSAITGGCLCGAVRWDCSAPPTMSGHCHCVDCRRSSGTGHCTHAMVPEAGFTCQGELRHYERAADSGNLVTRAFCPVCGSPVLSRNAAMPGLVFLRASSFDEPDLLAPQMVVYASRAPAWDTTDPALPHFALMPDGHTPPPG